MEDLQIPYLEIVECSQCQYCCHGIPTCLCGYETLQEIEQGSFPSDQVDNLILYHIPKEKWQEAAKKWWHYPSLNILEFMTLSHNGILEVLVIPKSNGPCLLLGDHGCISSRGKPFNCKIFPFHFESGKFQMASWCKFSDHFDASRLNTYHHQLQKLTVDYITETQSHQNDYFNLLARLKKIYDWHVHTFR